MKIQIKATNIELTSAIREYVEKKVESLSKFVQPNGDATFAEFEVGTVNNHHKSGDIFRAELHLKANGKKIYVETEKDDLYAAIDEVRDIAERECTSMKDKKQALWKRGAMKVKNMLRR